MWTAVLTSIASSLLKGLGAGLLASLLFFYGKKEGKDSLTMKAQEKELKDVKTSQTLKDRIDSKSDTDLLNGLQ